jgi:hypothetical protein
MEKFMGNSTIKPHFPDFYLLPTKAKVQHALVQDLKDEF